MVRRVQGSPWRQFDWCNVRLGLGQLRRGLAGDCKNANFRNVTFEQRVRCLRRAVSEKCDLVGSNTRLL